MFQIDSVRFAKLCAWITEQDAKVAKKDNAELPNYGACGGGYTYQFTPTSLGMCLVVINNVTHDEINLTDYGSW